MFSPSLRADIEDQLREALAAAADRRGPTVVSLTLPFNCDDPAACVFASRRVGDPFFCWEQPDRGLRLAALGRTHEVSSRGPDRFRRPPFQCMTKVVGDDLRYRIPNIAGSLFVS